MILLEQLQARLRFGRSTSTCGGSLAFVSPGKVSLVAVTTETPTHETVSWFLQREEFKVAATSTHEAELPVSCSHTGTRALNGGLEELFFSLLASPSPVSPFSLR